MRRARTAITVIGAAIPVLVAAAWGAAPAVAGREFDRAFRAYSPTHASPRRASGGVALDDLVLHGSDGATLVTAKTISLLPALSWPPVELVLDSLEVTRSGIAALQSFGTHPGDWETARTFAKRQFGNFRGARPRITLVNARVAGPDGEWKISGARGELSFRDPQHAELRVSANEAGSAGPRGLQLRLEAAQDAATLELLFDPDSDRALVLTATADAPGWSGF